MLEQMKKTIKAYQMLPKGSSVLVGVSGGPDSIALLHALSRIAVDQQWKVMAVHVNHGLRGEESDRDEAYVRSCCEDWEIPCQVERVDVKSALDQRGGNQQTVARRLRYAAFRRVADTSGVHHLALAHQADDQVETLLMRLLRGTGPSGLAGIPPIRDWQGMRILRPLLEVWRSEVEAYCEEKGLQPRQDKSNRDPRYTRSRIRYDLLPRLEHYNPRVREALLQLVSLAADEEQYWEEKVEKEARRVITIQKKQQFEVDIPALLQLEVALQRRVIKLILNCLVEEDENETVTLDGVERVRRLATASDPSGEVPLSGGVRVEREYRRLRILKAPPLPAGGSGEPSAPVPLPIPGEIRFPAGTLRVRTGLQPCFVPTKNRAVFDLDRLEAALLLRPRRPGDRIHLLGLDGTKKVKDALIDAKVPRRLRDGIPLVICGEEVIWVPGVARSRYGTVTEATHRFLCLEWQSEVGAPEERALTRRFPPHT